MSTVELDTNEWQQVMAILSTAPWRDANPLLMKIGNQLRLQTIPSGLPSEHQRQQSIRPDADGKEAQHE
jgi:hypothetical protein